MNRKLSSAVSIIVLCLVGVLSHLAWFKFGTILNYADWSFWPQEATKQLLFGWGTWLSFYDTGKANIQIAFLIFNSIWSIFAIIGLSYDTATKITFMIPIALLGFIGPYILSKNIFRDELISVCVALFYGSTTYFLIRQTAHLPVAFIYALMPLIIYFLIQAIDKKTLRQWLYFSLIYLLGTLYEIRIMILVTFVLILYLIFFHMNELMAQKKNITLSAVFILMASSFWLIPSILGGLTADIAGVANRGLFGSFLFDIKHALTLTDSSWTGGQPDNNFILQQIPLYLFLIPAIVIIPIINVGRFSFTDRKKILFFLSVALIGVFLTKQADSPIPGSYQWLYDTLPGFSLYREASKFFLLTSLGYAFLIGFALLYLKKYSSMKHRFHAFIGLAIITLSISFANLTPLIAGAYKTLLEERTMPRDYALLEKNLNNDNRFSRTLWVPSGAKWSYYDLNHPKSNYFNMLAGSWNSYAKATDPSLPNGYQISSLFNSNAMHDLIDAGSFRYIYIPSRDIVNDDDFFKFYGDDRDYFIKLLDSKPWLKRLDIGTKDLVVYENTGYKPYFTATTHLTDLPSLTDLDAYYTFKADTLGLKDLNVLSRADRKPSTTTTAPLQQLTDIFADTTSKDIASGTVSTTREITASAQTMLYANTTLPSYEYSVQGGGITFANTVTNPLRLGSKDIGESATDQLARTPIAEDATYSFSIGSALYPIDTTRPSTRTIGTTKEAINLYADTSEDLMQGGSFEAGLWHKTPEDCNAYDDDAHIYMYQNSTKATAGKKSLELSADKHTACTSAPGIAVTPDKAYSLRYQYQIHDGQRAGYDLVYNDPARTVVTRDQIKSGDRWYTLYEKFVPPAGATQVTIRLKGYPDDRRKTHAITYYDDVQVHSLSREASVADAYTPQYQRISVTGNQLKASASTKGISTQNLIPNPSIEDGPWQQKVGDCNAYDDDAQLRMGTSGEHTDGRQSLELGATRHVACTGPPKSIAVREGMQYLLNFDYQSPNSKAAGYYIGFDDANGTVISERLDIKDTKWQTLTKAITIPYGATHMSLSVYAYADDYGSSEQTVRYDNFGLRQIPDVLGRYYLVSTPTQQLSQPRKITFDLDSPTNKRVHVVGATTGFYLNMSESYHPQWRLELADGKIQGALTSWTPLAKPTAVPSSDHFQLNGFLNSWYVDPAALCKDPSTACHKNADGSYDIELVVEFTPQRWFYVGLVISGTTLVACVGYLVWPLVRRGYGAMAGRW